MLNKKLLIYLFVFCMFNCSGNDIVSKCKRYIDDNNYDEFTGLLNENVLDDFEITDILNYSLQGYFVDYSIKGFQPIDENRLLIISELIKNTKNSNVILEDGSHILFLAMKVENKTLYNNLIAHDKINLDIYDKNGKSLVLFLKFEDISEQQIAQLLLKNLNFTPKNLDSLDSENRVKHPLYNAIYRLETKKVLAILDYIEPIEFSDWSIFESLFHRYRNNMLKNEDDGNYLIFKKMIDRGFNLKFIKSDGATMLHRGIATADIRIIKTLLDAGIDVNAKSQGKYTALFYGGLALGGGPGREQHPNWKEIEKLFYDYGYIFIDY